MGVLCLLIILAVTLLESVEPRKMSDDDIVLADIPLSKSLGFSIREKIDKSLINPRIGHQYMELYNEMLKASQESRGISEDEDNFEVGTDLTRLKRIADRRRSLHKQSSVGNRRARSQALRREKLNSQSLRSHQQHIRIFSSEERSFI